MKRSQSNHWSKSSATVYKLSESSRKESMINSGLLSVIRKVNYDINLCKITLLSKHFMFRFWVHLI